MIDAEAGQWLADRLRSNVGDRPALLDAGLFAAAADQLKTQLQAERPALFAAIEPDIELPALLMRELARRFR